MSNIKKLSRRDALRVMAVTGIAGFAGLHAAHANAKNIGAMMPGKGWLKQGARCDGDGTPLQFIPKNTPDPTWNLSDRFQVERHNDQKK